MPCLSNVCYYWAFHKAFEGMVFVITGGGSGIGRALAIALASHQHKVLIVGRRRHPLKNTAACSSLIDYLCADVATSQGINLITEYCAPFTSIKALINNAGTLGPLASIHNISMQDWNHTLHTNLNAALFLPQKLHHHLNHGRVLNIGSGAAYFAIKGWSAYCVSKAALSMLTRCWQIESSDVHFASVMPGIVDTSMQTLARQETTNMDAEQINFYQNLKNRDLLVSPETVATFLTWLLLETDNNMFTSKEWDIYEVSHHHLWLKAPHIVPQWMG